MRSKHCMLALCMLLVSVAQPGGTVCLPNLTTQNQPVQIASDSHLDWLLSRYYETYASAYNFEDRIAEAEAASDGHKPQQIEILKGMENGIPGGLPASQQVANASPLLQTQAANAGLIIMGVPVMGHTLPIQDRTFLFTEYAVRVDRVISADHHPILPGDIITISRGGGELTVDGVLIKAVEPAFTQFQLNRQYIFMLHPIPETDSYRALGAGTFLVENDTVGTISPAEAARNPRRDLNNFLAELDAAVARKHSGPRN